MSVVRSEGEGEPVAYDVGICSASVCSPLDAEDTASWLNLHYVTGVEPWRFAEGEAFAGGQTNPCPCPEREGWQHYLFHC